MQDIGSVLSLAFGLVISGDKDLLEIVGLSLRVSLSALFVSIIIGLVVGALVATRQFWGRSFIKVLLNALMGLPPVVVGLMVYLVLSNAGPLGSLRLLYTPTAMIIAQAILITPIIAALSAQVIETIYAEYKDYFASLAMGRWAIISALLWDGRYGLLTVSLAGFGRAIAEVGAIMIVGGNIDHLTRVMTTAIALETSKGDLALAMALGLILITMSIIINAGVMALNVNARRYAYA